MEKIEIKYRIDEEGDINRALDDVIKKELERQGLHFHDSGFNLVSKERDLSFNKEK